MKEYKIQELKRIYELIDKEDDRFSTVRGFLLQVFEGVVSREFFLRTPTFSRFETQNSELIQKALLTEKKVIMQKLKINRDILKDHFDDLDGRSHLTGMLENKVIKINCLYSEPANNQLVSYRWIKNLIRTICEDFSIKQHNINQQIKDGFEEHGFDTHEDVKYWLTFVLSSNHELTGIIGISQMETLEFKGADFTLTNDSTTIIKILEKYGYRRDNDSIEESFGEFTDDELENLYDDDERDDEDDEDDKRRK